MSHKLKPVYPVVPDKTTPSPDRDAAPEDEVFALCMTGESESQIVAAIRDRFPGTDPKKILVRVAERIEQSSSENGPMVRGWCVEATRHVYQAALQAEDFSTALRAIKQLYELAG